MVWFCVSDGSVSNEKRGDRRRSRRGRRAERGRGREASVRAFRARVVTRARAAPRGRRVSFLGRYRGGATPRSSDFRENRRAVLSFEFIPWETTRDERDEASAEHVPRTPSGVPSSARGHYNRGRSTSRSRACAAVSARREMADSRALSRELFRAPRRKVDHDFRDSDSGFGIRTIPFFS